MLLKALLTRLNGGTDTSSTRASSSHRHLSKRAYEQFQNLPLLTSKLLCDTFGGERTTDGVCSTVQIQRVFPGMEIVARFGLPLAHRAPILQALWSHLEGSVWSLREKAAEVLSVTAIETGQIGEVKKLLIPDWKTQNALHGRLLYLRGLVARMGIGKRTSVPFVSMV